MATYSSILAWKISMDRGAWQATVHEITESYIAEWLSTQRLLIDTLRQEEFWRIFNRSAGHACKTIHKTVLYHHFNYGKPKEAGLLNIRLLFLMRKLILSLWDIFYPWSAPYAPYAYFILIKQPEIFSTNIYIIIQPT